MCETLRKQTKLFCIWFSYQFNKYILERECQHWMSCQGSEEYNMEWPKH